MKKLFDYAAANTKEILETLRQLVEIESCSSEKDAVDELGLFVGGRLDAVGARVHIIEQETVGDHLLADFGEGDGQVLVLGHLDTIWPTGTLKRQPFRVEHGLAFGPGIFDMKAGLAITLHALESLSTLQLTPGRRIRVLLNGDEENGSYTSQPIIEECARASEFVLCVEAPLGRAGALKTARKGLGRFTVSVTGRAAHAGNDPDKGISAIQELAHQILRLGEIGNPARGTFVNVGVVRGGLVSNQIADSAEAEVDLRAATPAEADRAVGAILGLTPATRGASVTVAGGLNRPVMERTDAIGHLFEKARQMALENGIELTEASVGGGSDGQFAAAVGAPVLDGLGAIGDGMFTDHEHIVVDSLPERTGLLASLLMAA
jgi:glutamate carboxypeptidase